MRAFGEEGGGGIDDDGDSTVALVSYVTLGLFPNL